MGFLLFKVERTRVSVMKMSSIAGFWAYRIGGKL